MPRLPTSLLRRARAIDPLLPALLGPCRELGAAQNELRWLREHVDEVAEARRRKGDRISRISMLADVVQQRASGKPLQYIFGTEFFGDLEICCRPGVLIPRQETAASVSHLTHLIRHAKDLPSELRVLDICTGTGCIPLLFQHEFGIRHDVNLRLLGIDISKKSVHLASQNFLRMRKNPTFRRSDKIEFMLADAWADPFDDLESCILPVKTSLNISRRPQFWDIVISNPPYISPSAYWKTTTRSVRHFEPKLALVPPAATEQSDNEQGDAFYPKILRIARDAEAKIVLLEVADLDQAIRVARTAQQSGVFDGIEIWCDQPGLPSLVEDGEFPVIGQGNGRSVLCWRGAGASWLGKNLSTLDERRLQRSYRY
ncbi:S-adenosyl-L-methionine-dependent methyltransferase [Corynespora cassiicola Philippines]|uniref:S-adenosyl-L-methionine-dependent methyltransferase n=1 Tax=Corynespora cassiicola Philippines TaxID=1448308 RepID=A0A2T2NZ33_CORCC|nr:S-adenosyl-L-methionine-dependent methyltransferase [Corynespora cassiicola Philippines]